MEKSDYALLVLLRRLGGVQGRKKLQKLAYLAKLSRLPLDDEFVFHYYGPYSSGLAERIDRLVEAGMLTEQKRWLGTSDAAAEYGYTLKPEAEALLNEIAPTVPGDFAALLSAACEGAAELKDREVFQLELASTLLYWRRKGSSWDDAIAITEKRKNAGKSSSTFQAALSAARSWEARCAGA